MTPWIAPRVPVGWAAVLLVASTVVTLPAVVHRGQTGVRLRAIDGDAARGVARAVVVEQGALAHTALMFPEDRHGRLQGGDDARAQTEHVLANLELALHAARTTLDNLVRLHVYVADAPVTAEVDAVVAARFSGSEAGPAATFVQAEMPRAGVLVAMDAIAAVAADGQPGGVARLTAPALPLRRPRASHVAIQPSGPFVVVSGRAARGEFDAAVRETMAQLRADLGSMGLTFDDVVQVKSFLGDMGRIQRLEELVAQSFDDTEPPHVVTEWRQEAVPAEIELIAAAPHETTARARVEHFEPIGGRYSRVARVNAGQPVFFSGLYGRSPDPGVQVDEMFAELQDLVQAAGSDMQHLVKATYYVSDTAADARINAIRPTVFDPDRPPAASKLAVRGTGRAGRGSTFDMIAVTTGR